MDDQPPDVDVAEWEPDYWPAPSAPQLPPWQVDPAADYDALWRKVPKVPDFMVFARAIPGYAVQFARSVPEGFVIEVEHGVFAVKCPCEETPLLRRGIPEECTCGRVYCHVGGVVRVAYTGDAVAPAP